MLFKDKTCANGTMSMIRDYIKQNFDNQYLVENVARMYLKNVILLITEKMDNGEEINNILLSHLNTEAFDNTVRIPITQIPEVSSFVEELKTISPNALIEFNTLWNFEHFIDEEIRDNIVDDLLGVFITERRLSEIATEQPFVPSDIFRELLAVVYIQNAIYPPSTFWDAELDLDCGDFLLSDDVQQLAFILLVDKFEFLSHLKAHAELTADSIVSMYSQNTVSKSRRETLDYIMNQSVYGICDPRGCISVDIAEANVFIVAEDPNEKLAKINSLSYHNLVTESVDQWFDSLSEERFPETDRSAISYAFKQTLFSPSASYVFQKLWYAVDRT